MKYATLIVSILILAAVSIPGRHLPTVKFTGFDKMVHIGMFGLWAITARYDLRTRPSRYVLAFLIGISFSLITEILQLRVEGRTFDPYDVAADVVGLLMGLLISGKVLDFFRRA
jgi:VanZ family protein